MPNVPHGKLLLLAVLLLAGAVWKRRQVARLVVDFFRAKTDPLNLAVFRIILFATILFHSDPTADEAVWSSRLPTEFIDPPGCVRFILNRLHITPSSLINATCVQVAWWLFLITCVTGLLGLFSRTSALLAVLSGVYALGVPQFYGKVDHYHHSLWFAALMAASPCGDALSLDAFLARLRGARVPHPPAVCYALPLRFVWLLMGLMYFFPGFWKAWNSGLDWALSDNLKILMRLCWMSQEEGWTPLIRLDEYPLLYKAGGLFTIAFEVSFVFLIFIPRLRLFAPLGGVLFHLSTWLSTTIFFFDLIPLYAAFVDWAALARRLKKAKAMTVQAPRPRASTAVIGTTGGVLVAGALLFGVREEEHAWPFACYPTFSGVWRVPQTSQLVCYRVEADGSASRVDLVGDLSAKMSAPRHRVAALLQLVEASTPELRPARLRALWHLMVLADPAYQDAKGIQFYSEVVWIDPPGQRHNEPVRRKLLFEWSPDGDIH
jgi:hypothetical protein